LKFSPSALCVIKNPLNFPNVCGGYLKISVNFIVEDATFMSKVQCAMLSSQIESLPSIFKSTKISSSSCQVKELGMRLFSEFVSHAGLLSRMRPIIRNSPIVSPYPTPKCS
jgi:hypothetical protein